MAEACKTCSESSECSGEDCPEALKEMHKIKNVIAVMSGKGGVGKSSVTGLLATALQRKGYKIGVMDADVTGPSIPKLFGLKGGQLRNGARGIIPAKTGLGIEVISVNLLLPDEGEPVIWRGPIISGVIKQFWTEVEWGELDYLLVDLPPGTGDVPLTVMQILPLTGVIIVTSPQNLVSMVVAVTSTQGAGVQSAQFIVDKGTEAVITGHVGPNAFQILKAAGVQIYDGTGLTVREAMECFRKGVLTKITEAGQAHAGLRHGHGRP